MKVLNGYTLKFCYTESGWDNCKKKHKIYSMAYSAKCCCFIRYGCSQANLTNSPN